MDNRGLLFIPDISGFTRFVSEIDIEHSRLVIQELLEGLINANQLGLQVSEVEGDAILFYKFGDTPDLESLYKQVEKMFWDFHRNLIAYDLNRFCQCEACKSAINLTLKVITHYGEFTEYTVKNFNKLIGKDVIVAHQLLKNDIADHEYWLVTKNLLKDIEPVGPAEWMEWNSSVKQTETGDVNFHYAQLGRLKTDIPPDITTSKILSGKERMFSVSHMYTADIITLFHATGDFRYRSHWQNGVTNVENISHFLPRVGMRYRIIKQGIPIWIYASSYSFHDDTIEFSETEEATKYTTYYTLEKIAEGNIKLTADFYIEKNYINQLRFKILHTSKMKKEYALSLQKLEDVVKEFLLHGENNFPSIEKNI